MKRLKKLDLLHKFSTHEIPGLSTAIEAFITTIENAHGDDAVQAAKDKLLADILPHQRIDMNPDHENLLKLTIRNTFMLVTIHIQRYFISIKENDYRQKFLVNKL